MTSHLEIRPPGTPRIAPAAVRGRRRGRAWVRVTHGIHRSSDREGLVADLAGWQLLMTSRGCFTGLTALHVRGIAVPPLPAGCPVFMALGKEDPRPQRAGVVTSRHIRPVEHEEIDGLRVATLPEALVAAARWVGLVDLVVMVDAALHAGDVSPGDLVTVADTRRPGAAALRRALEHVDGRSESPFETLLRLLHRSCDVEVEPQWVLRDEAGVEVARADLRVCGTTSLHEYDGDTHEEASRRVRDRRRDRRIDRAGHVRRGYTSGDLLGRAVTILEDADRALGRVHDPARIRAWHALLCDSLFTPAGTAHFLARLPRPARRR